MLSSTHVQVSNSQGRLGNARKPERQVTRMVVVMIVAFMVAWTPYAVFSVVVTAHPGIHLDPRLAAVPAFFSKTAAVYNPVIYVFMNKQVNKIQLQTQTNHIEKIHVYNYISKVTCYSSYVFTICVF